MILDSGMNVYTLNKYPFRVDNILIATYVLIT